MKKRFFKIISCIMILITLIASPVSSADLKYRKRIALMDKGEEVIKDFFNSKSENYYGKKVDAFFADEKNIQRVIDRAEEYAKKNATDTQYITPIYFNEELNNYIFSDLLSKLNKIHDNYSSRRGKNKYSISNISALDTKMVLGYFSYWYFVFLAGGTGAAVYAGFGGPWGWIAAGAVVIGGFAYCKLKKALLQREMIKTIKTQIEDKRAELKTDWRNSF